MIRVLLVDDHASFRRPLAFIMAHEPDIEVWGQAGTLAEARGLLSGSDVAVVDLDLPDGSGIDLVKELREANPEAAVLVLTARTDRAMHAQAVAAGASGVLNKSVDIEDIVDGVRRLGRGEMLLSPRELVELMRLTGQERERSRDVERVVERLTPREHEVLQALADGLSDDEIAERLHITTRTARTHMVNILSKLDVESRLQALIFALRNGIVHLR